ncbi:hypothetical protein EVA_02195 [gut metagenome]|uniref:Uncharacterized protein n=1 Tax=gut metagenome TaxID=749906 RepID=J9GNK6_9ZZZZ
MVLDKLLVFRGIMFAGEAVGVLTIREKEHFDIQSLRQKHVDTAQTGTDAGVVTIVEYGDVVREAVEKTDLAFGKRSTRGRHDILDAALVHGDHVGVALHKETLVLLDDGMFGKVEPVEFVALAVDFRFGRVDVFRQLLVAPENTSTEGNDLAGDGVYGEDDTAVVAVDESPIVGLVAEASLKEVFGIETLSDGGIAHRLLSREGEAQLEFVDDVVAETTLAEVGHADGDTVGMVVEVVAEVVACPFVEHEHAFAHRGGAALLVGLFLLLHLDAVFFRQPFQRLGVGHLFMFHNEVDRIAALSAGKAFAELLGWGNDETWGLLVVEGTEPLVVDTGFA